MQRVSLLLSLLLFTTSLAAAPAMHSTQISVNPMDGAKVVSALEEWMNGYGSKSKSRVVVHQHVADGANPASHTILSISPSVADLEAFNQKVTKSKEGMAEWQAFMGKVAPISRVTSTSRSSLIKTWGEVSDENTVWLVHALSTSDVMSVRAALTRWMSSATGKKFPGEAHLMASVAGVPASHLLALGYESQTEMEAWMNVAGPSGDLAKLLHTLSVVTEYHGASLSISVAAFGKSSKEVLGK